jgi:hypothetical protein
MSSKNIAVYGIYPHRGAAEGAVLRLQDAGFRNTDVSVLFSDNRSSKEFAMEKGTKAPEGTAVGAGTGAVIGGTLGWLAGIGALAIPAVGPFVAAGPIMGLLAGAGVGGTIGGIAGALVGLGLPEYEAKRFEGMIKKGGVLLSVHCDDSDWAKKAKEILKATEAKDISSAGEAKATIEVDEHDQPILKTAV